MTNTWYSSFINTGQHNVPSLTNMSYSSFINTGQHEIPLWPTQHTPRSLTAANTRSPLWPTQDGLRRSKSGKKWPKPTKNIRRSLTNTSYSAFTNSSQRKIPSLTNTRCVEEGQITKLPKSQTRLPRLSALWSTRDAANTKYPFFSSTPAYTTQSAPLTQLGMWKRLTASILEDGIATSIWTTKWKRKRWKRH